MAPFAGKFHRPDCGSTKQRWVVVSTLSVPQSNPGMKGRDMGGPIKYYPAKMTLTFSFVLRSPRCHDKVPSFSSTLYHLALHWNALQSVPVLPVLDGKHLLGPGLLRGVYVPLDMFTNLGS